MMRIAALDTVNLKRRARNNKRGGMIDGKQIAGTDEPKCQNRRRLTTGQKLQTASTEPFESKFQAREIARRFVCGELVCRSDDLSRMLLANDTCAIELTRALHMALDQIEVPIRQRQMALLNEQGSGQR